MNRDIHAMRREDGLSLVELMVALLLSTLLILGITQLFIDNKRNYAFQQGQSDNIENSRFALLILEEELYRTGYRSRPDDTYENAFRADTFGNCAFEAAEVINFDAENQLLCIRYQPNLPDITACDGSSLTGGGAPYDADVNPAIVELQIVGDTLNCNGTPLIDNLVDIKLLFGVSDDSSRETLKFKAAPAEGDRIRSIRYAALLKSRSENLTDGDNSAAYKAWRARWYGEANASVPDRALYLITESTIALRNLSR